MATPSPGELVITISTLVLYNLRYSGEPYFFNHNDEKTCLPFVDADFCLAVDLPNGLFPHMHSGQVFTSQMVERPLMV